jgi:hypothetical protein
MEEGSQMGRNPPLGLYSTLPTIQQFQNELTHDPLVPPIHSNQGLLWASVIFYTQQALTSLLRLQ